MYECIVKYEDVTTKDAVDLDKINAYLDKSVPDRDWLPIMKQTASECLTKTTSKLEDLKKSFAAVWNSKPEDCNVAIMSFVECLGTETLVNCPAKSWKNSKGCNELKQSILKCNGNVENLIMQYIGKVPKND